MKVTKMIIDKPLIRVTRDVDKLKRRVANKKLNEEEVKIIKEKKKQGYFYKDIWKLFKNKITLSGLEKIWYGQNWRKGDNK